MAQVHPECGFIKGSPDCTISHQRETVEAERSMLTVDPDSAMLAMGRALANGETEVARLWAEILSAAIQYEILQADRLGMTADATAASAIAQAVETQAVQTLQRVSEILTPARSAGPRHPAIYAALDAIGEFQGMTERVAG